MSTEDVWTLIRKAYVFSLPLVMMDNTRIISTNVAEPEEGKAPINQMSHARKLADASFDQVVTPNVDTLYSQVFFDLSEDALVIHKPAADRFLNSLVITRALGKRFCSTELRIARHAPQEHSGSMG